MRTKTKYGIFVFIITLWFAIVSCDMDHDRYEANWLSLKQHKTSQWLQDGKFGIYTYWGVYAELKWIPGEDHGFYEGTDIAIEMASHFFIKQFTKHH